jgi:hypothetical protein
MGHKYWIVPELKSCYYGKYKFNSAVLKRVEETLFEALYDYERGYLGKEGIDNHDEL